MNYIEGIDNYVKINDQGQTGTISFNLSKSLTSTSTPKDVQVNTSLQSKQKSAIKPDKHQIYSDIKRAHLMMIYTFRIQKTKNLN